MNKPYIKLWHFILEIQGYVILLISIIYGIAFAVSTEGEVPTHFQMDGTVDGYGSPATLLILPVVMLFCNVMMSVILHFMNPKSWNMVVKPTEANALYLYTDVSELMVEMEFIFSVYSLVYMLTIDKSSVITGIATGVMLVLMFGAIGLNIAKSIRHGKITG